MTLFTVTEFAKHDIRLDLNSCNSIENSAFKYIKLAGVYLNPIGGNEGYNSQLMWALQNEGWNIEI